MAFDPAKNFAATTVSTAPSPATSGTTLTLASGGGALMPPTPFYAVTWPASTQPTAANAEIVQVTGLSGDNVTAMARNQQGTNAQSIAVGWNFDAAPIAKYITDLQSGVRVPIPQPSNVAVSPTGGSTYTWGYRVTAVDGAGKETAPTTEVQTTAGPANLSSTAYNTITWTASNLATSYNVYRTTVASGSTATTGKIASISGTSYVDDANGTPSGSPPSGDQTGGLLVGANQAGFAAPLPGFVSILGHVHNTGNDATNSPVLRVSGDFGGESVSSTVFQVEGVYNGSVLNVFKITADGNIYFNGTIQANTYNAQNVIYNAFNKGSVTWNANDLLVSSGTYSGGTLSLQQSSVANDVTVVGVAVQAEGAGSTGQAYLLGVCQVNVVGAVAVGDLLVTSATAGRAQTNNTAAKNAIVGKALSSAPGPGNGTVWAFIG